MAHTTAADPNPAQAIRKPPIRAAIGNASASGEPPNISTHG